MIFDTFSGSSIKKLDALTIRTKGISSLDLMETAATLGWERIKTKIQMDSKLLIWCGKGNNGGDGWAIARLARRAGYNVSVVYFDENGSDDCLMNKQLFEREDGSIVKFGASNSVVSEFDIHIDAILGIGINDAVKGEAKKFIQAFNSSKGKKISIDIPSGLNADSFETIGAYVVADYIITFHGYKRALLGKQCYSLSNPQVEVIDIDLVHDRSIIPEFQNMQPGKPFPKRNKFDYKGSFNHTLVIGGNQDKGGAAILMTKACMHAGSGWTTVATHESHVNAILTSLPEAMTVNLGTTFQLPKEFTFEKYNVIGIGPGMGSDKHSKVILKEVIGWNKRYVFDADAIRILAKHPLWIRQLKDASSVFTPHLGELRDLIGGFENENEMLEASKRWVDEFQQYLLIKGPYSFLLTPSGKIFFNTTGNPGLAKAGSGDVLTGMIAGSIARHDNIESGIRWGVYLHGLAADIAIKDVSAESLLPSTVINYISKAILSV